MHTLVQRVMNVICLLGMLSLALAAGSEKTDEEVLKGQFASKLNGPVTDHLAKDGKLKAYAAFKDEVMGWLQSNLLSEWNPRNTVDSLHLERLVRSCANHAKQDSRFKGTKWSYTYKYPVVKLRKAVDEWNERHDALAIQSYVKFNNAYENDMVREAYAFGVRTLYHARAHIGARKNQPGKAGKDFVAETRQQFSTLFNHLSLSTEAAVLSGKPGFAPDSEVVFIAKVKNKPLPGLKLTMVLHGGAHQGTVTADQLGKVSLSDLVIPYVPNGTFFNMLPNPGAELDPTFFFTLQELEPKITADFEHTMMCKISRPSFSLKYSVTGGDNVVIPQGFSGNAYLVKFMRDSCHMDTAAWGTEPDVVLHVELEVNSYKHEKLENHSLKSEYRVVIQEKQSPRHSKAERIDMYEKSFDSGVQVPVGLFFWESAREIGRTIKACLLDL